MNWASPLFICSGAVGLSFLVVSAIVLRWPPRKINDLYGYRTARSKRDQASWDFAQMYANRLMLWMGAWNVLLGVIGLFLPFPMLGGVIISLGFMILTLVHLFRSTERALKAKFGE